MSGSDDHAPLMNEQEQEFARKIFSNFAGFQPERFPELRTLLRPSVVLSGDILLVERSPDGGLRIMLGDFTGHGVTAALGSILVTEIFQQLARRGAPMAQIIEEVNDRLHKKLPTGLFCAGLFLSLERHRRDKVTIWNCGLPPVLVASYAQQGIFERVVSNHLPLGLVDTAKLKLQPKIFFPEQGDHFYLYTDGMTEAVNHEGEMVGQEKLEEMIGTIAGYDNDGRVIDAPRYLAKFIDYFTGEVGQQDDITIAELSILPQEISLDRQEVRQRVVRSPVPQTLVWRMVLEIGTEELRLDEDTVSLFVNQITARLKRRRALQGSVQREIYLLLNEAWANALEHGVLVLDSSIRSTAEGFEHYYEEKEKRLTQLGHGEITLECRYMSDGSGDALLFSVKDSGEGFDYAEQLRQLESGVSAPVAHGRGIAIISTLCESVEFGKEGREIKMAYKLLEGESEALASKNSDTEPAVRYFK